MVANTVGNGYYGQGPLKGVFNRDGQDSGGLQQWLDQGLSQYQQQMQAQIGGNNPGAPNLGFGGGPGGMVGQPSYGGIVPPHMQPLPQLTNGAMFGGGPNIFNGGQGNFGPSGNGGGLSFGGGYSGYNNGVGAGTGFGATNYINDRWGDVASGFGVGGMSGGSRDAALKDMTAKYNRQ